MRWPRGQSLTHSGYPAATGLQNELIEGKSLSRLFEGSAKGGRVLPDRPRSMPPT